MTYNHDTGERYSNDNHPEFPISMRFALGNMIFQIYRVDDIGNQITCMSRNWGHSYIKLDKLRELFENGEAVRLEDKND